MLDRSGRRPTGAGPACQPVAPVHCCAGGWKTWSTALLRRGFTPTDALHVLGRFSEWNAEAARLGATLLAQSAGMTVEALCELIVERLHSAATELVTKILEDEIGEVEWAMLPARCCAMP